PRSFGVARSRVPPSIQSSTPPSERSRCTNACWRADVVRARRALDARQLGVGKASTVQVAPFARRTQEPSEVRLAKLLEPTAKYHTVHVEHDRVECELDTRPQQDVLHIEVRVPSSGRRERVNEPERGVPRLLAESAVVRH